MKGNHYPGHFKDREDGVWEGLNKENLVASFIVSGPITGENESEIN